MLNVRQAQCNKTIFGRAAEHRAAQVLPMPALNKCRIQFPTGTRLRPCCRLRWSLSRNAGYNGRCAGKLLAEDIVHPYAARKVQLECLVEGG